MYLKKPFLRRALACAALIVSVCGAVRAALRAAAALFRVRPRRAAVLRAFACTALAAACLALGGCSARELPSLRTFARPYLGEYDCVYARCGGVDLLEDLREVVLALGEDGTFTVTAHPKQGEAHTATGRYEFEEASGTLIFHCGKGSRAVVQRCLLEGGTFTFVQNVAGMRLFARFSRR